MRVYMVYVSSKADRVRAYSCMSLAGLLSVIIGPCKSLYYIESCCSVSNAVRLGAVPRVGADPRDSF